MQSDEAFLAEYRYYGWPFFPYLYVDGINLCYACHVPQQLDGIATYEELTAGKDAIMCEICFESAAREAEAEARAEMFADPYDDDLDPYYGAR